MDRILHTIISLLKQSAENAANSPSKKGMYEEKMPEAVRKLKKHL